MTTKKRMSCACVAVALVVECLGLVPGARAGSLADLAGYYPLDCNADDVSGSGNDGALVQAELAGARFGAGVSLPGSLESMVDVEPGSAKPSSTLSVALWFKEAEPAAAFSSLIYKAGAEPVASYYSDRVFALWTKSGQGFEFSSTPEGAGQQTYCYTPSGLYAPDEFVHVVGVIDAPSNAMRIYVNGERVGECAYGGDSIRGGAYGMRIGAPFVSNTDQRGFHGVIDDVRIYDSALSDSEVQELYSLTPATQPGCAADDPDNDGVLGALDDCPGTSLGLVVDSNGCSCSQKSCADANRCTTDSCNSATAACEHVALFNCCLTDLECADPDACTLDYCGSSGLCVHTILADCGGCTSDADCRQQQGCPIGFCEGLTGSCQCPDPTLEAAYLALGDSFSSGEGVPNFEPGTDTDINPCKTPFGTDCLDDDGLIQGGALYPRNECHRSDNAYSKNISLPGHSQSIQKEAATPVGDGSFDFYACSGAVVANVKSGGTPQYEPVEPPQLDRLTIKGHTNLITLTIGGNDIRFKDIILYCSGKHQCQEDIAPGVFRLIDELAGKLSALYAEIKARAPGAPVFVFLYPQVAPASGSCVSAGLSVTSDEHQFFRQITCRLNLKIIEEAEKAGVQWVDTLPIFKGHELCSDTPWFKGVVTGQWEYSYHPNSQGQSVGFPMALDSYIKYRRKSGWAPGFSALGLPKNPATAGTSVRGASLQGCDALGLSLGTPATVAAPTGQELLATTIPGELRIELQGPSRCPGFDAVGPSDVVRVRGTGFASDSKVAINASLGGDSDPVPLEEAQTDENGALDADVALPLEFSGNGPVFVFAEGPTGFDLEVLSLVGVVPSVPPADLDADGDGVTNACDNCPDALNSNQLDIDYDTLGDVCDSCPGDYENDLDGDGICAPTDLCPLDPLNDEDGDGVCADQDGCPWVFDPSQQDIFFDGYNDACNQICGSPAGHAENPKASDCLFVLRGAVGTMACVPECICDTNGDKLVKASDALLCLRRAVGSVAELSCGC